MFLYYRLPVIKLHELNTLYNTYIQHLDNVHLLCIN